MGKGEFAVWKAELLAKVLWKLCTASRLLPRIHLRRLAEKLNGASLGEGPQRGEG